MPMNGYTIGRDVTLDLVTADGVLVRPSIATGFTAKQDVTERDVQRLDGQNDNLTLPKGWSGDFDFERQNSLLDDYFAAREQGYYNGENQKGLTITQTINEPSGAVTQYRFLGVQLKYDDTGSFKGDDTVKQKVSWQASRRIKVA